MAGLLLVGCGADAESDGASDTDPTTSAATGSSSASASTEAPFVLPETCSGLLSLEAIDAGIGSRITGTTQYVVGVPEPGIGRTGRVTCSYGVIPNADGTSSAPLVQASVFTYDSAESAADRVEIVVSQGRDAGSRTQDVPVGDYAGVVIITVTEATLVVAVQDRNYAITLAPGLVSDDALAQAMASLAESAINGGQPVTTTTAPTATPTGTS
ncbi:MAG: hypothetical protein H0X18_05975 [Geodermatophilaceae bacterium]|nr:hypothetical protein [Geodermatophilaceae bacterium]